MCSLKVVKWLLFINMLIYLILEVRLLVNLFCSFVFVTFFFVNCCCCCSHTWHCCWISFNFFLYLGRYSFSLCGIGCLCWDCVPNFFLNICVSMLHVVFVDIFFVGSWYIFWCSVSVSVSSWGLVSLQDIFFFTATVCDTCCIAASLTIFVADWYCRHRMYAYL